MFGQVRLWDDCNGHCSFCSLNDGRRTTTLQDKQSRLMRLGKWMYEKKIEDREIEYDTLGLIGGELFCWEGLETEWFCLADAIRLSNVERFLITSNLTYDISLLIDFIDTVGKDTTVCTSFDFKGRFTPEEKELWYANLNRLHEHNIKVCCTIIPIQEMFDEELDIPDYVYINLCEPIVSCKWYFEQEHTDYHNELIRDMKEINLPERAKMLQWLKSHPDITEHYADYENTHSMDTYEFNEDNRLVPLYMNRLNERQSECGHQLFAKCYKDNDKCMQCDAHMILKELE